MASLRQRFHAVILAGGAGERFWPLSRKANPKPFLQLGGRRTLIEETLARAERLTDRDRIWVVCGRAHARAVREITGLPAGRVLVEPRQRNTAMAAALASHRIAADQPDAVVGIFPADHRIPDHGAFARGLRRCMRAAAGEPVIVTLGVKPTWPETGYGYIRLGAEVGPPHVGLHRTARFVEKPDAARARRYCRNGYLWNAGIFVWSAQAFLTEVERRAPSLHRALAPIRRCPSGRGSVAARDRAYRRAPSLPIDVAVAERSRAVWTLPAEFHWSDVGTWASLAAELGVAHGANHVAHGDSILDDARGNLVWANGRMVALLGVEGLAVIDAADALLVTRLDRSGEVRRVVKRLHESGRSDLI